MQNVALKCRLKVRQRSIQKIPLLWSMRRSEQKTAHEHKQQSNSKLAARSQGTLTDAKTETDGKTEI